MRRAVERGGFARALGQKLTIDARALGAMAAGQYARRLEGLLLGARRAQALVLGTEAVRRALADGSVALLLVATDAAGRRDELAGRAASSGCPVATYGTKAELGRLMSRPEVGVVAILDSGIAEEVAAMAARATELSEAE
jgi:ribosomal protein L7Ae-like RNA K-turn-binding protein